MWFCFILTFFYCFRRLTANSRRQYYVDVSNIVCVINFSPFVLRRISRFSASFVFCINLFSFIYKFRKVTIAMYSTFLITISLIKIYNRKKKLCMHCHTRTQLHAHLIIHHGHWHWQWHWTDSMWFTNFGYLKRDREMTSTNFFSVAGAIRAMVIKLKHRTPRQKRQQKIVLFAVILYGRRKWTTLYANISICL